MPSLSHQGTPSPDNSNEAVISTSLPETQKRQNGPPEYQLQREANIAENQQLLASLGLLGGGSALLDKSPTKGKRKKGGQEKRYAFCQCFLTLLIPIWFNISSDRQMIVQLLQQVQQTRLVQSLGAHQLVQQATTPQFNHWQQLWPAQAMTIP